MIIAKMKNGEYQAIGDIDFVRCTDVTKVADMVAFQFTKPNIQEHGEAFFKFIKTLVGGEKR